ncbi:dihydrofolate reductase [Coxiella endosymbiont of Ornithodoros amblus]|uniref:dihydrofolate reductase n=1 Tax=Coxiella endosymbiont of Ornithodoros amblus TaxID=1656166 RepID=UPI00244E330E|nr:dihydrofolate reductase [Coxiella endosymbiont of Ornithodoros amblus]MBW5802638.1 dihydrofolate reductase [Coxiella endosymbiont of Ornithodoros amblus]
MIITLIAAMDKNRLIGRNNELPWHLPPDLAHFKSITLGKSIVMGRRTFDSIGKPLPHRRNIVITQQKNLIIRGCDIFYSLDDALSALTNELEVIIIGGARIFKEALPKADKMILTIIDHSFEGDVYFPKWNDKEWKITSKIKHEREEKNPYPFQFLELKRLYGRNF